MTRAAAGRVYLDHASVAPAHPAALEAARHVAEAYPGDPARQHAEGRAARDVLEAARAAVAEFLRAAPERVVFTSGGTEAVHLAVRGAAQANRTRPPRVLSAAVEHSAVLAAAEATGLEHVVVPVDGAGRVELDALGVALDGGATLVNIQHANHETGTLQPVAEAARLCADADALLHVDACQTAGRLPVDLESLGADFVSVSGGKCGAGRGVGALAWSPRARFRALFTGDEREHRRRSGLEALPGAAALAETFLHLRPGEPDAPAAREADRCGLLRARLRARLAALDDVAVHGPDDAALPHIVAASALYVDGQALVAALDHAGFAVHSGSSCASSAGEPSHVLVAMGALTHGHVRVSLGPGITGGDVDAFADAYARVVAQLRSGVSP